MENVLSLPSAAQSVAPTTKGKHTGLYIGLGVGVFLLGTGAYFVFMRKDNTGNTKFQNWKNKASSKDENQIKQQTQVLQNQGYAPPVPAAGFPIQANTHNANTKNLQNALISVWGQTISGAPTDYLGKNTLAALVNIGYNAPVSQTDYQNILAHKQKPLPTPTGGGANFSALVNQIKAGSQNMSDGVRYPMQGTNNKYWFYFYTNGRFVIFDFPDGNEYVAKGSYSNGGNNMSVDGGDSYSGGVYANMQDIAKSLG